jgi:hypothetical protein
MTRKITNVALIIVLVQDGRSEWVNHKMSKISLKYEPDVNNI